MHVFTCCVCTKSFHEKIDLSFGLRKKDKFWYEKTRHFMVHVLSFLHRPRAMSFFYETLRTHMNYGDVHVKFFV
jgi:hypothetical protein